MHIEASTLLQPLEGKRHTQGMIQFMSTSKMDQLNRVGWHEIQPGRYLWPPQKAQMLVDTALAEHPELCFLLCVFTLLAL